jgi:hypothetical protein
MEWRGESTWLERVVHDGETLVCFCAFDLPDDAEPTELDLFASLCRNRDSVQLRAHTVSF